MLPAPVKSVLEYGVGVICRGAGWLVESFHRRDAIFTETMNCLLRKHPFDIDEAERGRRRCGLVVVMAVRQGSGWQGKRELTRALRLVWVLRRCLGGAWVGRFWLFPTSPLKFSLFKLLKPSTLAFPSFFAFLLLRTRSTSSGFPSSYFTLCFAAACDCFLPFSFSLLSVPLSETVTTHSVETYFAAFVGFALFVISHRTVRS